MTYFTEINRPFGGGHIAYIVKTRGETRIGTIVAQQFYWRRKDAERWCERASVRFIEGDVG